MPGSVPDDIFMHTGKETCKQLAYFYRIAQQTFRAFKDTYKMPDFKPGFRFAE